MIYLAFGLPVFKIISGSVKENKVHLTAYVGEKHGKWENFERTVNELRADDGINEIHSAINNPGSYQPAIGDVVEYFDKYCN